MATEQADQVTGASVSSPRRALCSVAEKVVPALYDLGERTWPSESEGPEKRWVFFGPVSNAGKRMPPRYKVLLRRNDLATLGLNWRLEVGGPVQFFESDESGFIHGPYGIRYLVYSVSPVFDEEDRLAGFGINCRGTGDPEGGVQAVDARVDCQAFVRSTDGEAVAAAIRSMEPGPRAEESRPGLAPTDEYLELMRRENRQTYFETRGVNQYVGPGWTADSLGRVFDDPGVRAVWIGHPDRPTAVPEPRPH